MTELLVHVLCYFVLRERSLFLSCGGLGLLLLLLLLIFQESHAKIYGLVFKKKYKIPLSLYIFIINI